MNYQSTKENDAISSNAMAATSHPLATEEALKILKKGGNAVDASITASIILSVVEPNATSIGGDCFAIIKMEGKEPVAYNGSGIAPEKANYDFLYGWCPDRRVHMQHVTAKQMLELELVTYQDWNNYYK